MFAVYYWDPSVVTYDQLYYTLPGSDQANQAYSAFNNIPVRNAKLNVNPLHAISLSNIVQCLPIFLRTQTGAVIATVYNGRLQPLAESIPGVLSAPLVNGYTIIVPKLSEPRGRSFIESRLEAPECVPDLGRRIGLIKSVARRDDSRSRDRQSI